MIITNVARSSSSESDTLGLWGDSERSPDGSAVTVSHQWNIGDLKVDWENWVSSSDLSPSWDGSDSGEFLSGSWKSDGFDESWFQGDGRFEGDDGVIVVDDGWLGEVGVNNPGADFHLLSQFVGFKSFKGNSSAVMKSIILHLNH